MGVFNFLEYCNFLVQKLLMKLILDTFQIDDFNCHYFIWIKNANTCFIIFTSVNAWTETDSDLIWGSIGKMLYSFYLIHFIRYVLIRVWLYLLVVDWVTGQRIRVLLMMCLLYISRTLLLIVIDDNMIGVGYSLIQKEAHLRMLMLNIRNLLSDCTGLLLMGMVNLI